MKPIKYLSRFSINNGSLNDNIEEAVSLIKQIPFVQPEPFQTTSYGFEIDPATGDVIVKTAGGIVFTEFVFAERVVPSQLIKAHLDQRVRELKSTGQTVGKRMKQDLSSEIKQELTLSTPPSLFNVQVCLLPNTNQVWLLCSGKSQSDKISKRLMPLLKSIGLHSSSLHKEMDPSELNQIILCNNPEIEFPSSLFSTKESEHTDEEFLSYHERMKQVNTGVHNNEIDICWNRSLLITLTNRNELKKVVILDELNSQWFENGDEADWTELACLGMQILITELVKLSKMIDSVKNHNLNNLQIKQA